MVIKKVIRIRCGQCAAIPVSFFTMSIYGVAHIIEDFKAASKEKNN